jgi:pyruvate dehydrogenase E2 component (dihydrolipoamide acetyltransferase)
VDVARLIRMPTEVVMPRLGWDMQVGAVAEWLKRDGERVEAGEPICTIVGDKVTTELEAEHPGILRLSASSPDPGVEVPVGTLLAHLIAPGEEAQKERRVVASPRARRAATRLGLEWRTLQGSGRGGRVLERDVTAAAASHPPTPAAEPLLKPERTAESGIRRLTAERMALSARTVAPVTLTTEVDATNLVHLREQALAERLESDLAPGYTDLLVKLVASALADHPALNIEHSDVNIAIAVDTQSGLVAPVIHHAESMSVESIARESTRLVTAARDGKLRAEDVAGATFTITNLGMYDIDAFTPIVNLPQCAILGVGRIVSRPVVVDESTQQIGVRRMLTLSLTFDHRVVDGAPAARFLQHIKHLVERPTLWLFH